MNDVLEVHKEAIVDFARFALAKKDELEPWSSQHADEMYPSPASFGAVSESTNDVEYEYMPLTPEEFRKHTGLTLDPSADPGPGIVDAVGTDAAGAGAFLSDAVGFFVIPIGVFDLLTDDTPDELLMNWIRYYTARGASASIQFPYVTSDAPWANDLHTDWCEAVDNRTQEVDEIRNEIDFVVPRLAIAAEKYADTDLENALGIDDVDSSESTDRTAFTDRL